MSDIGWEEEMQQARNTYEKELRDMIVAGVPLSLDEIKCGLDGWDRCSTTVLRLAFLKIMRTAPHNRE